MRFFGIVLVSVGFLGAVLSVSVGVIESLSAAPGATVNAAVIFAILGAAAFTGGAAFFAGGMICRHLDMQLKSIDRLVEEAETGAEEQQPQPRGSIRAAAQPRPAVVRLGGPGPRATNF